MISIPVAHAGHYLEGALYLAPVLILAVVLFVQGRKGDSEDPEGGEPTRDAPA